MELLRQVVPSHVPIVEDCACAAGAVYKGKPAGSMSSVGVFSFHPRKSITTGEGGMITTNDEKIFELCNQLRNHGASLSEEARHKGPSPYLLPDFKVLGFNYRMTDLQGAVGLVQLSKLREFLAQRRQLAEAYLQGLSNVGWLTLPAIQTDVEHAWQAFVTLIEPELAPMTRNAIMDQLHEQQIWIS